MQAATVDPFAGVDARKIADCDDLAVAHADIAQPFAVVIDEHAAGKDKVECLCHMRRSALVSGTARKGRVRFAPRAQENQGIHLS